MKPAAKIRIIYNSTKTLHKEQKTKDMIENNFKSRKWLTSMLVGEIRLLPNSLQKYHNVKATCHQLKVMGEGEWKINKEIDLKKGSPILPDNLRVIDDWKFVNRIPLAGYTLVRRVR